MGCDSSTTTLNKTETAANVFAENENENEIDYETLQAVDADNCPFARTAEVMTPFLPTPPPEIPSVCMMPAPFLNVSAPRVNVTIRNQEFPSCWTAGQRSAFCLLNLLVTFTHKVFRHH